jgi:ketosteroid isomerase-like protein
MAAGALSGVVSRLWPDRNPLEIDKMLNLKFSLRVVTALCLFCATATQATASPASQAKIAKTIEADVAELIAGINAHDPDRATRFDAPGIVSMESGRPPSTGAAANKEGLIQTFKYAPSWRVSKIDETVDVAGSGDMAVYRSTYNQDSDDKGVPMTQKVNFLAGFKLQPDGSWKIGWSVVCATERPHKK